MRRRYGPPPPHMGRRGTRRFAREMARAEAMYMYRQRLLWGGTSWLARWSWTHRRGGLPVYAAALLGVVGSILGTAEGGARTAGVMVALSGFGMFRWVRRTGQPRRRVLHGALTWVGASVWLVCAAAFGAGPPMPGLLFVGAVAAGTPWWWWHRPRGVPELEDWQRVWDEWVAAPGTILPNARLDDREALPNGWTAEIAMPPGKATTTTAVSATERIASAYGKPVSSVIVEPTPSGNASRARITVLEHNPLEHVQPWPGPQLLDRVEGMAPIGPYHDGELAYFRYWRRGSGPVHSLISGCTGSGKSVFIGTKLATERHSGGLMASWICCPQGGQSFPDWMDHVALSVDTPRGGAQLLEMAVAVMRARSDYMAKMRWVDDKGRNRRGKGFFEPTVEMPLLRITIEESPDVMAVKGAVENAKTLANMGRKTGIGVDFVTQMPLLSELGNSAPLRAGLTSGNVVVFRTADRLSGQVSGLTALDNGSVDPYRIPKQFADGSHTGGLGYTLGGSVRPAMMRSYYDPDPYEWATAGETVQLDDLSSDAAWHVGRGLTVQVPASLAVEEPAPVPAVPEGPTTVREAVLVFLRGREVASTSVIARGVDASMSTVSTTLKRLTEEGLVAKERVGTWSAVKELAQK